MVAFANRPGLHGALRNALTDLRLTGEELQASGDIVIVAIRCPLWCPFGVNRVILTVSLSFPLIPQ